MDDSLMYKFRTDNIHYKAIDLDGKKNYYVEGYISTGEKDLYNDIVTESAMESMLKQINERQITLDYDHEVWRDSNSILPVGKIVEAKIDETGLWVKCKLNPASPKFKNLWGSIKGGFVTAFSIAFKPLKTLMKTIGEIEVRLLEDLKLLNVALTGAPVNETTVMTDFGMKSVMLKAISEFNTMEELKMSEEETKVQEPEVSEEVEQVEEKEEAQVEEPKVEEKSVNSVAVEELTAQLKSLTEKIEKQEAELKSFKEKEVFKAVVSEPVAEMKSEDPRVNVLNFIR